MIKKMYCIETDKNSLYVDKDVYDYVVSLEQQCKKQQLMIDKAIKLLNAYIGVLDDTSDLYFENVKSILESVKEK